MERVGKTTERTWYLRFWGKLTDRLTKFSGDQAGEEIVGLSLYVLRDRIEGRGGKIEHFRNSGLGLKHFVKLFE